MWQTRTIIASRCSDSPCAPKKTSSSPTARVGLLVSVLLVASIGFATPSGAQESAEKFVPPAGGVHRVHIPLIPLRVRYDLPHTYLVEEGVEARLLRRPLTVGRDLWLDPVRGEIRLLTPFQAGDTLEIAYRTLPLCIASSYGERPHWRQPARDGSPTEGGESEPPPTAAVPASVPGAPDGAGRSRGGIGTNPAAVIPADAGGTGGPELELSGNKSVVVEFGSTRDATLRQSFDISANGRVGGDVDVVAILSDRNTALGEGGATLDLQELDKLLVEVRSPVGKATLGDYTLQQNTGQFGIYERELTGARVQGLQGGFGGQAALAESKGRFHSLDLQGIEGRQGPYVLTDESGNPGVSVVAGSDVVWVDGARMTRGDAADYSIDYARGLLTFSARRPVSSDTRISVDYQIASTAYRRLGTQVSGGVERGPLRLYGHAYREYDEVDRPNFEPLTPEDVVALAQAGDDRSQAIGSGVREEPGDYDRVEGSDGTTYFAFAGVDSGAYSVQFLELGAGQGTYVESTQVRGRSAYRFVGAGAGTHSPGRRLRLPQEHSFVGGGGRLEVFPGVFVDGEMAQSRLDVNRLSSLGDGDDRGGASRFAVAGDPALRLGGRSLGTIEFAAQYKNLDESFVPIGRIEPSFFQEDWGFNVDRRLAGRESRLGRLAYRPRGNMRVGGERAWLETPDGLRSNRWRAVAEWSGALTQTFRFDRVDSYDDSVTVGRHDGYRNKLVYTGEWSAGNAFRPSFRMDNEDRVPPGLEAGAIRYRSWDGSLRGRAGLLSWTGGYGFRRDFTLHSSQWRIAQTARTVRAEATARVSARFSATVGGSQRRSVRPGGGTIRSDNGYTRLRQGNRDGTFQQDAALEWSGESLPFRLRELRFVGEGSGAYDSLGNFSPGGGYEFTTEITDETIRRMSRTRFSYRIGWQPAGRSKHGAGSRWWRDLRTTTTVQSTSSRDGSLRFGDLFSFPGWIESQPGIALGSFLLRQEIETVSSRSFELYLRLEHQLGANRQSEILDQTDRSLAEEARLRFRRGRQWLWELRGRASQGRAELDRGEIGIESRRLDALQLTLESTWIRDERLRFTGQTEYEQLDGTAGERLRLGRIGPRATYTIGNRLRAEGQARWTPWIDGRVVPVLTLTDIATLPERFDFRIDLSYRVRELANLGLVWSGRALEGGPVVQSARGELRAFF